MTLFQKKYTVLSIMSLIVISVIFCFLSISQAQADSWTYKTPMPTARCFLGSCVLDGKIYAIGGATSSSAVTPALEVYDPLIDTWTQKANMPVALCFVNVAVLDGKIYVFGGKISAFGAACKQVFIYTPDTDEWTQIEDTPHDYGGPVTAVVDGQAYLIGGANEGSGIVVPDVSVYNPATRTWTEKADMPTPRIMHAACVYENLIACIGGTTENWTSVFYRKVEVYDPLQNTWTTKNDMPVGRWGLAACTLDSLIYVTGGYYGQNSCNRVDILNPISNDWSTGTPMQQIRRAHVTCVLDGKIYALGGSYTNGGTSVFLSSLEVYDTDQSTSILNDKTNGYTPDKFHLGQNYPNPFNPQTTIQFKIPFTGKKNVKVKLYINNLLGQSIRTLINDHRSPGYYQVQWDGLDDTGNQVSAGIYLLHMKAGDFIQTKKLILQK